MRPVIRSRSQLPLRRSYKPLRLLRASPSVKLNLVFKPSRGFGSKPRLDLVP